MWGTGPVLLHVPKPYLRIKVISLFLRSERVLSFCSNLFIYFRLGWVFWVFLALRAFLSLQSGDSFLVVVHRLLTVVASLIAEHEL